MQRRTLLRSVAFCALAAALPAAAWPGGRHRDARPAGGPPMGRYGRHYVVDGWVLTERDVAALAARESDRAG